MHLRPVIMSCGDLDGTRMVSLSNVKLTRRSILNRNRMFMPLPKTETSTGGISTYNEHCRAIVMRYSSEWRSTVERIGRWIDFDKDYKTLDTSFMESVVCGGCCVRATVREGTGL